jgi:hypothetical protein
MTKIELENAWNKSGEVTIPVSKKQMASWIGNVLWRTITWLMFAGGLAFLVVLTDIKIASCVAAMVVGWESHRRS